MTLRYSPLKENLLLIAVTMADLISTIWLIGTGRCIEMNPIMNYFLSHGWAPFIGFKLLTVLAAVGFTEWYRHRDEKFTRHSLRVGVLGYVLVWVMWFTMANK